MINVRSTIVGPCARARRTGRLRGNCEEAYLRGPASDQRDAEINIALTASLPPLYYIVLI